jgi:hypothetical protein
LSAQVCGVIVTCQNWTRLWYRGQGSRVHHFPNIFHAPMLIDHGCLYVRVPRGAHLHRRKTEMVRQLEKRK